MEIASASCCRFGRKELSPRAKRWQEKPSGENEAEETHPLRKDSGRIRGMINKEEEWTLIDDGLRRWKARSSNIVFDYIQGLPRSLLD